MENPVPRARQVDRAYVLALGFGTAVTMWALGYAFRLPPAVLPTSGLLSLLLLCLLFGGFLAGRFTGDGWRGGFLVGGLASLLNLLVLGSLLGGDQPNEISRSAVVWIPGSVLAGALLGALGGAVASRRWAILAFGRRPPAAIPPEAIPHGASSRTVAWTPVFAAVGAAATLLLLVVGGIVTSQGAGLAVVDWPNSYGYQMFLYPLGRMSGGIYYEHAHRLFGSLVGLTTLVLAIHLQRVDPRPWLKRLGFIALFTVVAQGVLGGLRVTGRLTLSASPEETAPNLSLAVLHAVLGQVFFGLMVAITVFTSNRWRRFARPRDEISIATDPRLSIFLVLLLLVQLVLGAVLRHFSLGLMIHLSMAAAVLLVGLIHGIRLMSLARQDPWLGKLGRGTVVLLAFQFLLGFGALVATGRAFGSPTPPAFEVIVTTTHQVTGALLLAVAVVGMLWHFRLRPAEERVASIVSGPTSREGGRAQGQGM